MGEKSPNTRYQCLILGIISNKTTEEDKWISLAQLKKALIMKYGITNQQIEKNIKPQLKILEKNSIIIRKHTSYALACLPTYEEYKKMMEKTAPKGNDNKEDLSGTKEEKQKKSKHEKDLGPDVIITSTGRVSVKKSYVF